MRTLTPPLRALVLGVGAIVGVVLLALAAGAPRLSDGGKLLDSFPGLGRSLQPVIKQLTKINGVANGHARSPALKVAPRAGWVGIFEVTVLGITVIAAIWFLVVPALRQFDWSTLRLPPEVPEEELEEALVTPAGAEQLSGDVRRMIESLDEDDGAAARHAVLRCWLGLEEAAGRIGVARPPAESSAEFTTRVLAAYDVDDAPLARLHGLYRVARYAPAPVSDEARRSARAALEVLRQALAPRSASAGLVSPPAPSPAGRNP